MKIVSGLGSIDDYELLANAGADEFFCGYVPHRWNTKHGVFSPLNRREVLYYNVQIGAKEDLKILRNMVDYYGVPVKITFNSLCYAPAHYPLIGAIMEECIDAGFDVFILADPALMLYVRQQNFPCKIHVSGEVSEVNRPMMDFFEQFGITRYIFHRKNTIQNMKQCIQANESKGWEYEAFALNEYCHFTGGFCNSLHCDELAHLCKVPYQMGTLKSEGKLRKILSCQEWQEEGYLTGSTGCGLCALKEMKNAGITHLKLVGRGNHPAFMEADIKQMRKAIQLVEETGSVPEYKKKIKETLFEEKCSGVCYYR